MESKFELNAPFKPNGDQPKAIKKLLSSLKAKSRDNILMGVTGSGKTFTIASVIAKLNKPTLILSPNKVLAAQLYAEFKSFFPKNAVEYFISYYDYYQPEAYIPQTDTYIEKDASINKQIEKLRLKATTSILTRPDTIVIASVSCIYNIGSPENFSKLGIKIEKGQNIERQSFTKALININYKRNDMEFQRGTFRIRGNMIDVFPADADTAFRMEFSEAIPFIYEINPLTGDELRSLNEIWIYPATHFVSTAGEIEKALVSIEIELAQRLKELKSQKKLLEYQRLEQRVNYDMEMLRRAGYCHGIENYSRHFSNRPPGSRPDCLLDYFPKDFLLFMDESHVGVPQLGAMYEGDRSRKNTLVNFGFRLPSALDNRPLKFAEFEKLRPNSTFVSATPGKYEKALTLKKNIAEQIIRPTGLLDPEIKIIPLKGQIKSLMAEIEKVSAKGEKTLVLTLTKKNAEDLSGFFADKKIKAKYIHSSMDTLTRLDVLGEFREGKFDVLVGINLLREGLDMPEVSLVAILNADNEGFLRSETTLMQISGRAARNRCGTVIFFADRITNSMERAMTEMSRRRKKQAAHNKVHHITPQTIKKRVLEIKELAGRLKKESAKLVGDFSTLDINPKNLKRTIKELDKLMKTAADNLSFELAAEYRDRLFELKEMSGKK
jgi:excinuclease ABC subunit B